MKTKVLRRVRSLLLIFALVVTAVSGSVTTVKAATKKIGEASGVAEAGVEIRVPFAVSASGDVDILFVLEQPTDTTITLYNGTGTMLSGLTDNPMSISASDYADASAMETDGYSYLDSWKLQQGNYFYGLVFASETNYTVGIEQTVPDPRISETKTVVTVGYTKNLSVTDGTVKSWTSSRKSIATVDKNGKVTAKKVGEVTITATLTDGTKLKCTVTVKENKYTAPKPTMSNATNGKGAIGAYSASFDKDGNLVVKVTVVNNTSYTLTKLKDVTLTVKNGSGTTVGTSTLSSKMVSIPPNSSRNYSATIKKSSLREKSADLRISTITCAGTYCYVY